MEFRYRAGERVRNFDNPSMNHYYSSSTSIARFSRQRFNAGFDTRSFINGSASIPGQYLLEKIREERMREEMLAMEIARKRMLEEEILREMESLQHFPVNVVEEHDYRYNQRSDHGFERALSDRRISRNDDEGNGGYGRFDESKRVEFGSVESTIPWSKEMPNISLDMKFPTKKLCGIKRKATSTNKKKIAKKQCTNQKKITGKKEWSCSLCRVTATSKKALNRHIKGKKHQLNEARLTRMKATTSNSNADSLSTQLCYEEKCITFSEHTADKVTSENSSEGGISVLNHANDMVLEKEVNHRYGKEKEWWCKVCQVQCNSEAMLQFHFGGKKHKARSEMNESKNGEVVLKGKSRPKN